MRDDGLLGLNTYLELKCVTSMRACYDRRVGTFFGKNVSWVLSQRLCNWKAVFGIKLLEINTGRY